MKIIEIIERVDETRPNAFSEKVKLQWLSELEGKIAADVMMMGIQEIRTLEYKHPDSLETEPLVSYPHQDMYAYWLEAKIDYANGEYSKYQNSMEMFNQHYVNFVRWFASTYNPANGYPEKAWVNGWETPPYYISAYGLAVKHGFRGTEKEWLDYLGRQGFYEIDLRDAVTVNPMLAEPQSFDLSEVIDSESVQEAIDAGKTVRVQFKESWSFGVSFNQETTVLLDAVVKLDNAVNLSGVSSRYYSNEYRKIELHIYRDGDGSAKVTFSCSPDPHINLLKQYVKTVNGEAPDEDGNVEIPVGEGSVKTVNNVAPDENGNVTIDVGDGSAVTVTAVAVTENADGSVTMVNTLSDGSAETIVITADANGNPNGLTVNGTAIPVTWTEVTA